jgi:hypothetical protein
MDNKTDYGQNKEKAEKTVQKNGNSIAEIPVGVLFQGIY